MSRPRVAVGSFVVLFALVPASVVFCDEGMWLFTNPPTKSLKEKYDFEASAKWLEHVQRSSVRFNDGGSGSFVSADGLVMTNHHVGSGGAGEAQHAGQEPAQDRLLRQDPGGGVQVRRHGAQRFVDHRGRHRAGEGAATPQMNPTETNTAQRKMRTTVEKECEDKSGLDCQVVTLYQGGRYHLYQYKRFTDVRLVMARSRTSPFRRGHGQF